MTNTHQDQNPRSQSERIARYSRTVGSFLSHLVEQSPVGSVDGLGFLSAVEAASEQRENARRFSEVGITRVIQETAECRSFEFDPGNLASFDPRPGQFIPVRVKIGHIFHERCYAVSSLVARGDAPRFTVKRVPGGLVSNWCHDELKRGTSVSIGQPAGQFGPRATTQASLVFLAAGIGIAPILPMFKEAALIGNHTIKLMIFDRDDVSAPFLQVLRDLAHSHSQRVTLVEIYTGPRGTVDQKVVEKHLAQMPDADILMCGPAGFTQCAENAALAAGIRQDRIFVNDRAEIPAD